MPFGDAFSMPASLRARIASSNPVVPCTIQGTTVNESDLHGGRSSVCIRIKVGVALAGLGQKVSSMAPYRAIVISAATPVPVWSGAPRIWTTSSSVDDFDTPKNSPVARKSRKLRQRTEIVECPLTEGFYDTASLRSQKASQHQIVYQKETTLPKRRCPRRRKPKCVIEAVNICLLYTSPSPRDRG